MVTNISVSHYNYNIDLYVNGKMLVPVEKGKTKSTYIYESEEKEKLRIYVCQNDNGCCKLKKLFSYLDFGFEFGELYFWPTNIYCQYYAETRAGNDISLFVCVEKEKELSFIQNGRFIIQSSSDSKVKNEKHSTLIPRKRRFSFYFSSIFCQTVCNSLLMLSILLVIMLSFDVNSDMGFFDDFSTLEIIGFWILIGYQIIRLAIFIFVHTKILIKDDGTYYEKKEIS
ncbi:MAG: hypothetical protein PUE08_04110 [Eubacteriales bacterium]|nr:hypothetical protein [Eubacteriales bacterium]